MEDTHVLKMNITGTVLCTYAGFDHISTVNEKAILNGDILGCGTFDINLDCFTTSCRSSILATHCINTAVTNCYVTVLEDIDSISVSSDVNIIYQHTVATCGKNRIIATVMDIQVSDLHVFAVLQRNTIVACSINGTGTVDVFTFSKFSSDKQNVTSASGKALNVAPASSARVTLLFRWIEPVA